MSLTPRQARVGRVAGAASGAMPSSAGASDHGVASAAGAFLRNSRWAWCPASTNTSRNFVVPPPVAMPSGERDPHALQER